MDWKKKWSVFDSKEQKRGGQGKILKVFLKEDSSVIGALKLMHPEQSQDSGRRCRLTNEAKALNKVSGAGIPKLYDSFDGDDTTPPYFILEWIDGFNLNDFFNKNKKLFSIEYSLKLTRKFLSIIDRCHQEKVFHRDIKPDNIMISSSEDVYLVDFGISWIENINETNTALGEEIGNRFLRLPEHASGSDNKRDHISDITFCVGILFFLITGDMPRQLKDSNDKMPHERSLNKFSSIFIEKKELLKAIRKIFKIGFQHNPLFRYQTCIELIQDIDKAMDPPEKQANDISSLKEELRNITGNPDYEKIRNAVEGYEKINNELCTFIRNEIVFNGTSLGQNNSREKDVCTINMYINNDMFPNRTILVKHIIFIKNNKTQCTFSISRRIGSKNRYMTPRKEESYCEVHIVDEDTLREEIFSKKDEIIKGIVEAVKLDWVNK